MMQGYFFWMDLINYFETGVGIGFGMGMALFSALWLTSRRRRRRKFMPARRRSFDAT